MDEDKLLKELAECLEDIGLEYARMSLHGQSMYDEACSIMNQLLGG